MPEEWILTVEERSIRGQGGARRMRRAGRLPGVVYGGEEAAVAISVDTRSVHKVLRSERGVNTLLTLRFEGSGQTCKALIREVQADPLHDGLLHADFLRISMTQEIQIPVHLEFEGTAAGVKTQDGVLHVVRHEIEISCLPGDIPESIHVDVSELEIGDEIRIGDLPLPEGVNLDSDPARMVVHVVPPTRVEVEEAAAEEEEAVEEAAEGAPAEPEPEEGGEKKGEKKKGEKKKEGSKG